MQAGDKDCVFCKIVAGEIPSHIYWQNDNAIAFLDIRPKVPGHSLVVPKSHSSYLFDMGSEDYGNLLSAAKYVARGLKDFTGKNRICVIVEGFAVDHAHIHLIPSDDAEEFGKPALPADMAKLGDLQVKLEKALSN